MTSDNIDQAEHWDLVITPRKKWWDLFLVAILTLSIVGIAVRIIPGYYNRPFADDFCTVASVQESSIFQHFISEYINWTGRFSYNFLSGIATSADAKFFGILPGVLVLSWLIALTWCLLPLIKYARIPSPLLSAIAGSSLFLCFIFNTLPKLFESAIWVIGSINYELPMILLTIQVGMFLRSWYSKKPFPAALVIIFSFISGGFSEIFGLMQIVLFALVILYLIITKQWVNKKLFLSRLLIGFIAATIAFFIVYIAPGNAVRQAASHHIESTPFNKLPWELLHGTLVEGYLFVVFARFWLFPIFLLPFTLGLTGIPVTEPTERIWQFDPENPKKYFKSVFLIPGIALIVTIAAALPSAYIQAEAPVSRAMILVFPFFIMAIQLVMFKTGSFISRGIKTINNRTSGVVLTLAILALVLCIAMGIWQTSRLLPIQKAYANNWDARDQELKSLAVSGVVQVQTYKLINAYGYTDLDANSKNWINRCVAAYYGLQSIESPSELLP